MENESSKIPAKIKPRYVLGGTVMEQHLSGADTGTLFSLFENRAPASSRTPIHIHAHDDETFFMLEGEMTAVLDGEKHLLVRGESIFLPRHVPHQLIHEGASPARYLLICTPGGFEGFLQEGGTPLLPGSQPEPLTPEDIERMRNAAPRFGITILSGWPDRAKHSDEM